MRQFWLVFSRSHHPKHQLEVILKILCFATFFPLLKYFNYLAKNNFVVNILTTSTLLIYHSISGPSMKRPKSYEGQDDSMLCKRVVTKDRRYITQITCYEKGKEGLPLTDRSSARQAMRMPLFGKQGGGVLSSLFSKIGRQGTFRYLSKPK